MLFRSCEECAFTKAEEGFLFLPLAVSSSRVGLEVLSSFSAAFEEWQGLAGSVRLALDSPSDYHD